MAGYYGIRLVVCVSIRIFCFQTVTWININGFSQNLVWDCKWAHLVNFCPWHTHSFISGWWLVNINGLSPNFVCALVLWRSVLGLLMGKFCQFLTKLSARNMLYFHFRTITLVNINLFSPNLVCALILWWSALRLLMGKFRQFWRCYLTATHPYSNFRTIT